MNATKQHVNIGVANLDGGQSTSVLAYPSKAGSTVECVGPVVRVSLTCKFPEILSDLLAGSGCGGPCFHCLANRGFNAS